MNGYYMTYPKGVLEISSCETRCDDGDSHVGISKPEKTPDSSDAMVVFQFQQLQEKKPNNKLDSTALGPGAVTKRIFHNLRGL